MKMCNDLLKKLGNGVIQNFSSPRILKITDMEEGAPKGPLKNPKEVKGALEGSITMKM